MVPLSESLLREIQQHEGSASRGSDRVAGVFEFLTPLLERWIRALSNGATVAYIETEYFGGEGFERVALGSAADEAQLDAARVRV